MYGCGQQPPDEGTEGERDSSRTAQRWGVTRKCPYGLYGRSLLHPEAFLVFFAQGILWLS